MYEMFSFLDYDWLTTFFYDMSTFCYLIVTKLLCHCFQYLMAFVFLERSQDEKRVKELISQCSDIQEIITCSLRELC